MTPAGLEPAIPGSVGRCLIHWATGPSGALLQTQAIRGGHSWACRITTGWCLVTSKFALHPRKPCGPWRCYMMRSVHGSRCSAAMTSGRAPRPWLQQLSSCARISAGAAWPRWGSSRPPPAPWADASPIGLSPALWRTVSYIGFTWCSQLRKEDPDRGAAGPCEQTRRALRRISSPLHEHGRRSCMTPAGLEPAIPGSVGRCLIHWAAGPPDNLATCGQVAVYWISTS